MRRVPLLLMFLLPIAACAHAASSPEGTSPPPAPASPSPPPPGRFQLVVVPGHTGSPFLVDTATGCVWHQVQNPESKRTTLVEVDVENLHWSWGSGAQQMLASRIDGASLTAEQKRALKDELKKTACGFSHVVLTPGAPSATGQAAPSSAAPSQ